MIYSHFSFCIKSAPRPNVFQFVCNWKDLVILNAKAHELIPIVASTLQKLVLVHGPKFKLDLCL